MMSSSEYQEEGTNLFVLNYSKSELKASGNTKINIKEIKIFTNIINELEYNLNNIIEGLSFGSDDTRNYERLFGGESDSGVFYPYKGTITDSDVEEPFTEVRITAEYGYDPEGENNEDQQKTVPVVCCDRAFCHHRFCVNADAPGKKRRILCVHGKRTVSACFRR